MPDIQGLSGAANGAAPMSGGMSFLSTLGTMAAAPAAQTLGDKISTMLFGKKKVQQPHIPTGAELGKNALDYYNTAFPGTTSWERLGTSNPSGGIAEASVGSQTDIETNRNTVNQANRQMMMQNSLEIAKLFLEKRRVDNETMLAKTEAQKNKTGVGGQVINTIGDFANNSIKPLIDNNSIGTIGSLVERLHRIKQEQRANNIHLNRSKRFIRVKVNGR